jgi:hypothetical protein
LKARIIISHYGSSQTVSRVFRSFKYDELPLIYALSGVKSGVSPMPRRKIDVRVTLK